MRSAVVGEGRRVLQIADMRATGSLAPSRSRQKLFFSSPPIASTGGRSGEAGRQRERRRRIAARAAQHARRAAHHAHHRIIDAAGDVAVVQQEMVGDAAEAGDARRRCRCIAARRTDCRWSSRAGRSMPRAAADDAAACRQHEAERVDAGRDARRARPRRARPAARSARPGCRSAASSASSHGAVRGA